MLIPLLPDQAGAEAHVPKAGGAGRRASAELESVAVQALTALLHSYAECERLCAIAAPTGSFFLPGED
ncbi:hypothetical protein [Streptomyces yangpuensis]|uniref:hypothetical protein n=1 Tax=Streptomyces yangpuensis TaxID=1648182 RepID=UPI003801AF64